jgi:hypothetical protein
MKVEDRAMSWLPEAVFVALQLFTGKVHEDARRNEKNAGSTVY